ncbi:M56 family metallopeptidase [Sphingomonas sp. LT1P40]|uniref:M56 family metallopeptidase n=1 Tax=Alteristakelama amylovorans TaxID=3096166 RepID=UPI002FC5D95C
MIGPFSAGWVLETFVATTLLMLLVLAIRKPVSRHFGPNIAYALWALPVLRLALPPLPESWRASAEMPVAAASDVISYYIVVPLSGPDATAALAAADVAPIDWFPIAAGLWAIGAAAFLGWHLIAHSRFCSKLLKRARVDRTVAEGRVRVIETDAATGPLAFGIFRKYVAFPRDFNERYDPLERNLALAHELGHHLRGDLIANWIALIVLALHWFNPVAWRAFRAFRADQEMACDALVLAGRAPALRHAYGRAIVKSAHGGAVSAACHLHTINELKGRLKMLSKHDRKSRSRIAAGVTGAVALTLGALALTASGTQAAANLRADVGEAIGVDLQTAPPTPAELPTPPEPYDAPPPPEAPDAPDAPEAPDAPKAKVERRIVIVGKGKDGEKREVRMIRAPKDGQKFVWSDSKSFVVSGDDIDTVTSSNCGPPKDGDLKIESKDGGKRRIVICTDRIEARAEWAAGKAKAAEGMARQARVFAVASADMGKRHAMMGLRMARKSIEMQDDLSPDQKAAALRGIDDAVRELEDADKD